ncbi:hypothetical protein MK137Hg34_000311600, partial [Viscerimonas tarda]
MMKKKESRIQRVHSFAHYGDFVRCNYCDKIMVLPVGADKCSLCYYERALAWEKDDCPEADSFELAKSGKYKVIFEREELKPSEYLSDEVLINEFETCPDFRFRNRANNYWEILDNGRKIYSGTKDEMETKFARIVKRKNSRKR